MYSKQNIFIRALYTLRRSNNTFARASCMHALHMNAFIIAPYIHSKEPYTH